MAKSYNFNAWEELTGRIITETEKAVLVQYDRRCELQCWLPKSQIEYSQNICVERDGEEIFVTRNLLGKDKEWESNLRATSREPLKDTDKVIKETEGHTILIPDWLAYNNKLAQHINRPEEDVIV